MKKTPFISSVFACCSARRFDLYFIKRLNSSAGLFEGGRGNMIENLGDNCIGSRAAIGVASLPSNTPVEITLVGKVE